MIAIKKNIPLANYTTLKIGGPARFFVEVGTQEDLKEALAWARQRKVPHYIMAGGSNLLVADEGFDGLVIKVNIQGIEQDRDRVRVKAGTPLPELVNWAGKYGLAAVERLTGIAGSVGGAIFGNAGAYGQTISDKITRVRVLDTETEKDRWLTKAECRFDYRDSGFKQMNNLIILEAEFGFDRADPVELRTASAAVLSRRLQKYPPGVLCPGSFFKNLPAADLPEEFAKQIPIDYYGKMPAGYFLDLAGAKGQRLGNIKIAPYHANLFINEGGGRASDFFQLAKEWKTKVKEKFGIELEPEVQLVGFRESL